MYAAVIPALKVPRQLTGPFDYAVPAELSMEVAVGSLVLVPWRGRKIPGVVWALHDEPGIAAARIKPIASVIDAPGLPPILLGTLDWMAAQYFCAPATVLHCFLPEVPKRVVVPTKKARVAAAKLAAEMALSEKRGSLVSAAFAARAGADSDTAASAKGPDSPGGFSGSVVRYATTRTKFDELTRLVGVIGKHRRSTIIVAPHLQDVDAVVRHLASETPEAEVLVLDGERNAGDLWRAWARAASGDPVVVVGTRMAVAAPVPHLGAIAVLESDSPDHKQYDQNPRYDARAVALRRCETEQAHLTYLSHAPRAEEYVHVRDRGFLWRDVGGTKGAVSLTETGRAGGRTAEERLLSPRALEAVDTALQSQKKVLLFHNRRGTATALVCRDCGRVDRCPTCLVPSRVHGTKLHCHRCGAKRPMPSNCVNCQGASLRTSGVGTGTLAPMLQSRFPEARIALLDADDRLADLHKADIVIGTQVLVHAAAELPDAPAFGAVIATSVDSLLGHPGFRTTENAWRTVRSLADVAAAGEGPLILQTLDNENPEVRELLEEAQTFLIKELGLRERAGYPPAAELVTVTVVGDSEAGVTAAVRKLVSALRVLAGPKALVSGPLRPGNPFRHGKWRSLLVVKAPVLEVALIEALRALPEEYIIDRDPEYLG